MTIRWVFGRRLGSKGFQLFANWGTCALVVHCARIELAGGLSSGENRARQRGPAGHWIAEHIVGCQASLSSGRRSQCAGGLRLRSERLRRRRSFRRRRFAHKRTIESRGQFKCAIAGLSPFSGFNADSGGFETYGVVRSRLSGEPEGKRDATWLRQ